MVGGATTNRDDPAACDKLENKEVGRYFLGDYNTYNKKPLNVAEMLQLPKFSGTTRLRMELRKRGKEVGFEQTA